MSKRLADKNNRIEALNFKEDIPRLSLVRHLWLLFCQPNRIPQVIKNRVFGVASSIDWDSRADKLGAYSIIDSRHTIDEYDYVTRRQKEIIYPYFLSSLNGYEQSVLDFGCGAGRFTSDLAEMINGKSVGLDITQKLINICPPHEQVKYICDKKFFDNNKLIFDVVWVCLVLGGLTENEIVILAKNIEAVLADNGLLFIVESTGDTYLEDVWRIRTRQQLSSMFPLMQLKHIGTYFDVNQEISVLAGRKL